MAIRPITIIIITPSSTRLHTLQLTVARSPSIISRIILMWPQWAILPIWITMASSIVLRYPVEITQPIAVVENLLLIAMLTLSTSLTSPMLVESFQMGVAPSQAKSKSMKTKQTWTTVASARTPMQLPPASTTHRNRALLITIMLWTKLNPVSCRTYKITDLLNSLKQLPKPKATGAFSKTTFCFQKRVPTLGCWKPFIIANNQLLMVPNKWQLPMCTKTTTMALKELFKEWKCIYE